MTNKSNKTSHFSKVKEIRITELAATLRELTHTPTGATILQIENDDPENLFCISFRTTPKSSNGVAHILEHTVLCGSKKFPVKDPFFSMTRRSLSTFMNALTGADFTCYPAASQIEKDFYNLLEVYLDAVFYPILSKESFSQEGHRLEFQDPLDSTTPLTRRGIVYNEMKGAMNNPDSRLWHATLETLVPELTYAYNSGGDPEKIPELSYEELLNFHKTYYHPSHALFFFYGNLPLEPHLDFLEKSVLSSTTPIPPLPQEKKQNRFLKPVAKKISYPTTEKESLEKKAMVSFGWLLPDIAENQEVLLALQLLDSVLMETDASPLRLALLQSGLCVSAQGMLDTEMSEIPYVIFCKGCDEKAIASLKEILFSTLEKLATEGISSSLVEAALHQLEFSRTEISPDLGPFGLTLFMKAALARQHNLPPENTLLIHSLFQQLRKSLENPNFLPHLLRCCFLGNPHFSEVIATPDPNLLTKEEEKEKKSLLTLEKTLSKEARSELVRSAKKFQKFQANESLKDPSCLPKISLLEAGNFVQDFPLKQKNRLFSHKTFTNGIFYADLVIDLPQVPPELFGPLSLLAKILPQMGNASCNYVKALEQLQLHTGGLSSFLTLGCTSKDSNRFAPTFTLRSKAMNYKSGHLVEILSQYLKGLDWSDVGRIEELLAKLLSNLENNLPKNALRYASSLAISGFSDPLNIAYNWHGLPFFHFIRNVHQNKNRSDLLETLEKLSSLLFLKNRHSMVIAGEDESLFAQTELLLEESTPISTFWTPSDSITPVLSQGRIISSQVAFTCMAFKVCTLLSPEAPALTVAAQLMENLVLHKKIREEGGAYGSGASYNPLSGYFTFHSYRDPHLATTLQAFEESIELVAAGKFTSSELEEAKLGILQSLDSPVPPGERASIAYGWLKAERKKEERELYRREIIRTTSSDIKKGVEEQLLYQLKKGVVVSLGSKDFFDTENDKLIASGQNPLPIMPI